MWLYWDSDLQTLQSTRISFWSILHFKVTIVSLSSVSWSSSKGSWLRCNTETVGEAGVVVVVVVEDQIAPLEKGLPRIGQMSHFCRSHSQRQHPHFAQGPETSCSSLHPFYLQMVSWCLFQGSLRSFRASVTRQCTIQYWFLMQHSHSPHYSKRLKCCNFCTDTVLILQLVCLYYIPIKTTFTELL